MTVKILVVEDETYNRMMAVLLMQKEGYDVEEVDNPTGAMRMLERDPPHLILLDINFGPRHINGFQFYKELQRRGIDIPVIFMTSRDELDDKLEGLEMGADDYITKPYSPAEVVARVRRTLHRVYQRAGNEATPQQVRFPGIELDVVELTVNRPGKRPVSLTKTEMKLLLTLMQHAEQVVIREDLLTLVWGDNYPGESNIVDSYIRKLRKKIEPDVTEPFFLRTVRGSGYKFSTKQA
jgi:DNA-binding response OmpR family regulator